MSRSTDQLTGPRIASQTVRSDRWLPDHEDPRTRPHLHARPSGKALSVPAHNSRSRPHGGCKMRSEQVNRVFNHSRPDDTVIQEQLSHRATREQAHLRNYDPAVSYDSNVRHRRGGRCAIARQIYRNPGELRFLGDLTDHCEWQVIVSVAGKTPTRKRCSIGSSIGLTASIECCNDVVGVNERGSIA
jgi:hypothetical protein